MGTVWKSTKRGTCAECGRPIRFGDLIWEARSVIQEVVMYSHLVCDAKNGGKDETGRPELPKTA